MKHNTSNITLNLLYSSANSCDKYETLENEPTGLRHDDL
jgi:hypothetical protein